jgi:aspartate/methionine/tyrosine aminotransferase
MPIQVTIPNFEESLTTSLVPALETTYAGASCPVKALVLANPHNPLGRCYSRAVLEECFKFCDARGIHLVSDEVFALSTFESPDLPDATPFTSALSLDPAALGCDPSRIHVIWSMSKDFGSSGIKLVCLFCPSTMRN